MKQLLNLFKKEVATTLEVTPSKYPKVVQEIHNEFFTAGDCLLEQANAFLKQISEGSTEKGKRLASLGFSRVPEVARALESERRVVLNKEISDLVMRYRISYPTKKFITHDQVLKICGKYNLVLGGISMYKGFVPEKNLLEIENFKVKQEDVPFMQVVDRDENVIGHLSRKDFGKDILDYLDRSNENELYITGMKHEWIYSSLNKIKAFDLYSHLSYVKARSVSGLEFNICAPLKDMEIPEGKALKGRVIQNIPDPVVLQCVYGGYIIVTAWGDEASDPMVQDERMN